MWWILGAIVVFFIVAAVIKAKMLDQVQDFFSDEEIEIPKARGFIRGAGVDPFKEEQIINECKLPNGKIDRNKFLKWAVQHAEEQKPGSGRKILEAAGFSSISQLS